MTRPDRPTNWAAWPAIALLACATGCAASEVATDPTDGGLVADVDEDIGVIGFDATDAVDAAADATADLTDGDGAGADSARDASEGSDGVADTGDATADTVGDTEPDVVTRPQPGFVAQSVGGLVVVRDDIRVQIGLGAPQPVARLSNDRIRLSIGPVPR